MPDNAEYVAHSICRHCDRLIGHGGSKALAQDDAPWFGEDDDFMCPDGEQAHEPAVIDGPSSS